MFRLFIIFSLLLSVLSAEPHPLKKVSVQLLWADQFEFAGFYVAKEKGFYQEAGLDVEIKPFHKGLDIAHDVASGKTTYGIGYSSILVDKANGLPITAIGALFQSSPLAIVVKRSSGIRTVNDLKNKRVMITQDHENDASILAMLTSRGLRESDFKLIPHSYNVDDLVNDKTDAMLIYTTNEPYQLQERGVGTVILDPKDYGFDFYGDILYTSDTQIQQYPEKTKAFYEATMRGWRYAFEHIDETVNIILDRYNTQNKSKSALTFEAEALKKLAEPDTSDFGKLNVRKLESIDNIYHLMGILRTNYDMKKFVWERAQAGERNIVFTDEEKKYIKNKQQITMCVDPDWMPFEAVKDGRHIGLSADYISHFSKVIGLPVVLVPTTNWAQSLQYVQQHKCDILSLAMETPKRNEYLNFTQPYITSPIVFATRANETFVTDFKEITSKRIGITKADGLIEILQHDYPGINLIEVDSIDEGLKQVASGENFAFVDTLHAISYAISNNFYNELKIAGKLEEFRDLRVGVRKDDPILVHLFDKAIGTLSNEEQQNFAKEWIAVKYEKGVDYNLLIKISMAFFALILLLAWWNRKLFKLNEKIKYLSIVDELSGLYNRRYFNTKFMQTHALVTRERRYFFFILFDIDNFKKYNDLYGHLKGDDVISSVGKIFLHLFNRSTDIAFRLGGEEFGCFGSSDSIQGALEKAEEIRLSIQALSIEHLDNPPYNTVTVSGGIIILSSESALESQEIIYQKADKALYEAKETGRNKIVQAQ